MFVFCLANLTATGDGSLGTLAWSVVKGSALALLVGGTLGLTVGKLAQKAHGTQRASASALRLTALVLPFLAYAAAVLLGGNGFVAAFVAGLCYAPAARAVGESGLGLVRDVSQLMAFATWFVLGGLIADEAAAGRITWAVVGYALLALTAARVLPVVLSLSDGTLTWSERAAVGWLGSRGVTSIVFAVLAATQLPPEPSAFILDVMCATVLLSVLLHGLTVTPIAQAFHRARTADALPGRHQP